MPAIAVHSHTGEQIDDDEYDGVVPDGAFVRVPAPFMDSAHPTHPALAAYLRRRDHEQLCADAERTRQDAYEHFKGRYRTAWRKPGSGPWGYPVKAADGGELRRTSTTKKRVS